MKAIPFPQEMFNKNTEADMMERLSAFPPLASPGFFPSALIGSAIDCVSACETGWSVIVHLECRLAELADSRKISHRCPRSTSLHLLL